VLALLLRFTLRKGWQRVGTWWQLRGNERAQLTEITAPARNPVNIPQASSNPFARGAASEPASLHHQGQGGMSSRQMTMVPELSNHSQEVLISPTSNAGPDLPDPRCSLEQRQSGSIDQPPPKWLVHNKVASCSGRLGVHRPSPINIRLSGTFGNSVGSPVLSPLPSRRELLSTVSISSMSGPRGRLRQQETAAAMLAAALMADRQGGPPAAQHHSTSFGFSSGQQLSAGRLASTPKLDVPRDVSQVYVPPTLNLPSEEIQSLVPSPHSRVTREDSVVIREHSEPAAHSRPLQCVVEPLQHLALSWQQPARQGQPPRHARDDSIELPLLSIGAAMEEKSDTTDNTSKAPGHRRKPSDPWSRPGGCKGVCVLALLQSCELSVSCALSVLGFIRACQGLAYPIPYAVHHSSYSMHDPPQLSRR
jgi:hypothetical protein